MQKISTKKRVLKVRNDYKDFFESWKASIRFEHARACLDTIY